MIRLERLGLALALASLLVILSENRAPATWPLRATVLLFGLGIVLLIDAKRP